jgi:hypothetical protein
MTDTSWEGADVPKGRRGRATCDIDGCDGPVSRLSLCRFHAYRWERYGDATYDTGPEAKYWRNVECGAITECWPWLGTMHDGLGGYGSTAALAAMPRRNKAFAHRVGFTLWFGPIPDGLYVLHRCDYPPCQNPWHWFLGTYADNARDKARKGRVRTGTGTPTGLVTAFGESMPLCDWADRTGIASPTIRARITRLGWPPERALTERVSYGPRPKVRTRPVS